MGNLPNPVAMIAVVAALGIAPFAALMVTSYTKLVVVFGLLRSALGIQQVPPNIVLNGIALILTVFIMAPVGMDMVDNLRGRNFNLSSQMSVDDVIAILDAAQPPVNSCRPIPWNQSATSSSNPPRASGPRSAPPASRTTI